MTKQCKTKDSAKKPADDKAKPTIAESKAIYEELKKYIFNSK